MQKEIAFSYLCIVSVDDQGNYYPIFCIGLSDVASILARRVALEVSDSDEGPSDSEYDSDDWGNNIFF